MQVSKLSLCCLLMSFTLVFGDMSQYYTKVESLLEVMNEFLTEPSNKAQVNSELSRLIDDFLQIYPDIQPKDIILQPHLS